MAAPRADRAGDPELAAPLGREHHEDQEDQQDAGGDREAAERREERHEGVALLVGRLERVPLDRSTSRPSGVDDGLERSPTTSSVSRRRRLVAPVRDQDVLDLAGPAEQPLGRGERQEQRGAVGAGAVVATIARTATRQRVASGVQRGARVAALSAEARRPRRRSGRPRRRAGRRGDCGSPSRAARIVAERAEVGPGCLRRASPAARSGAS